MAASPAGQANERIAVDIHPIGSQELQQIRFPASVHPGVFQSAVYVARRFDKYEGKPTGCQLVLGCPSMNQMAKSMNDPTEKQSSLLGKLLEDCGIEGMLREEFSRDGGILIDGRSGKILATKAIFFPPRSDLVCAGHGTRHNSALNVAARMECVVIVRSQDGYVTVFSSEHLRQQECTPRCFRLKVEDEPGHKDILTSRTQDRHVTVVSAEHLPQQDGTPRCFCLKVEDEPGQKDILISVYGLVLHEHFRRLMEQALAEFKRKLPEDGPYQHCLEFEPDEILAKLPEECRKDAKEKLKDYFDLVESKNNCKGEMIQNRECEERVIREEPTFKMSQPVITFARAAAMAAAGAKDRWDGPLMAVGARSIALADRALALTGGWQANRDKKSSYTMIVKCTKEERIVDQKVNGSYNYGQWKTVEEWTEENIIDFD